MRSVCRKIAVFIVVMIVALPVYGDANQEAFNRLSKVERFAFGGTGIAGVTSQGELDFRILFEDENPKRIFQYLFNKGNLQAKFYALVALNQIDEIAFFELSKEVVQSGGTLTVMNGCIVMAVPVEKEVERIHNGDYSFYFSEEYHQQLSWKNKLNQTDPSHK